MPHLVIFARAPLLGQVKRRLARDIGAVAATRFYRATLARTARRLGQDPRWVTWLAVTPDGSRDAPCWPPGIPRFGQGEGDLGRRMARALRRFGAAPAIVVGSDIPDLDARHVAAGFRALGRAPLVFGPAADGGYWLIGVRHGAARPTGLFADVRWSTRHALADTLRNLPPGGAALIETLADIDDGAAYMRWRSTRRVPMR
jgi:rSAM/selenodomain-associated transferase 1